MERGIFLELTKPLNDIHSTALKRRRRNCNVGVSKENIIGNGQQIYLSPDYLSERTKPLLIQK